jgi:tripartite-type tricarboxylate transporter receptor subunit TctC/HAMP domain-containing protein
MTIVARLRLLAALPVALIAGMLLLSAVAYGNLWQAWDIRSRAADMQRHVFALSVLTYDYILYGEERAAVQWHEQMAEIKRDIEWHAIDGAPLRRDTMLRLVGELDLLLRQFSDTGATATRPATAEQRAWTVSQFITRIQELNEEVDRIRTIAADRFIDLLQRFAVAALAIAAAAALSVLALAGALARRIATSLQALQRGAATMSAGNLAYRVEAGGSDEHAALATSLNEMAVRLQGHTAKLEEAYNQLENLAYGRVVADQLSKRLGQSVVVENRPGAGSIVGTQAVVTAPPDGYTLLVGGLSNIVFNAGLYKKLAYDPLNDLVPVALVFNISYTLVGSSSLPYANVQEIVAAAKKNPGALKVANAGVGTGQHVVGAAFQKITGTKMLEVSYRGSSAAFPDLIAGRVDLFFDSTPAALPQVTGGKVKGFAILTAKRHPQMPDVPTMTEAGVAGLEIDSWIGLFAPAKTPPAAIARLQREIAAAYGELKLRFEQAGGELMQLPPERLVPFVRAEYDRWLAVIRDAGISLD